MRIDLEYATIMVAAIALGFHLHRRDQRSLSLRPRERWGLALGAFVGAMVGARLPFVLRSWEEFLRGATWFADGKTILTGLVGGYLGVESVKWAMDIRVRTGDSFAVSVPAGVAIGRLACFRAGCCFGLPTDLPWGVVFPAVDLRARHPTQLYEAAFHALVAGLMGYFAVRGLFRFQRIKIYIILYALYRLLTENLRPEPRIAGGWTAYQLGCVGILIGFGYLFWRDEWRIRAELADASDPTSRRKMELSSDTFVEARGSR